MRRSFIALSLLIGCPSPPEVPSAGAPSAMSSPGGDGAPPGDLSAIITGEKIKLSGKVEGAQAAYISVLAPGATPQDMPTFLAMFSVTDGKFAIDLPHTYDKPLYLTAVSDLTGDGPSDDDLSGVSDPIKPAGKDLSITVKLSTDRRWSARMPWQAPSEPSPAVGSTPTDGPPASAPRVGAAAPLQ